MSEQEIREGMLLAVWDEPPLHFDPDTLIRRVEQRKSRRRALVGVGVATAMIAVASFALPGLLPRDRDTQLGSETQMSSSAPPSESADMKVKRIGNALAAKLALRMTNLNEVYAEIRSGRFFYPPNMSSSTVKRPSEPEFTGYIHLTDPIGPTALRVEALKGEFSVSNFCATAVSCRDVLQTDGSTVMEAEYTQGGSEIAHSEVVRRFPSGLNVRISSHNLNPASGSGLRQTVPVRVGVLTELITDPSIDWE